MVIIKPKKFYYNFLNKKYQMKKSTKHLVSILLMEEALKDGFKQHSDKVLCGIGNN